MLNRLKAYIEKEDLFQPTDRILLAVSGGVDSVMMCHLFKEANYVFGIAHCNFRLRSEDSISDAVFVKNLAQEMDVPFFEIAFDTQQFATENKLSIQVAARELRYEWLEKIRKENDFEFIATAHHLNDSIETVLYNFTKGSGIRGLHGILSKNGKIVRPLLFAEKSEIVEFVEKEKIPFREDASNASEKYSRNLIRHQVIPVLKKINPALENTMGENIERLKETEKLYNFAIELLKKEVCEQRGEAFYINLKKLQSSPAPASLLFEILSPFGFNNDQTRQMLSAIDHLPGAQFFSPTHEVLLDRDFFIVKRSTQTTEKEHFINQQETHLKLPKGELFFKISKELPDSFPSEKTIAWLDLEKLTFPLKLRKWKTGDVFCPFGMKGKHKKISDLFTDLKLSRFEKDKIWILESAGKICWVVGWRMDERFKIEEKTSQLLKIEWSTSN